MAIIVFFLFVWMICKGIKALFRPRRKAMVYAPAPAVSKVSKSLAALEALQAQRDELQQQLDLINGALDAAPPEKERLRWLKERTRAYGQMATVEAKISKLIG